MPAAFAYTGPACPRCNRPLDLRTITEGEDICPSCQGFFEAHVFRPPQRVSRVVQLAEAGPEGASACANHLRNAATTSCDRCGVFICGLCELEIGGVRYCPSCFDRLSENGTLDPAQARRRDYVSLALVMAFLGLVPFAGVVPAGLAIYYAIRAFNTPELREGRMTTIVVSLLLAIGTLIGNILLWLGALK
jgi:hypothetical protein